MLFKVRAKIELDVQGILGEMIMEDKEEEWKGRISELHESLALMMN